MVGLTVGAMTANQFGGKNASTGFGAIAMLGFAMSFITNIWSLIAGRFLQGVSSGAFLTAGSLLYGETITTLDPLLQGDEDEILTDS